MNTDRDIIIIIVIIIVITVFFSFYMFSSIVVMIIIHIMDRTIVTVGLHAGPVCADYGSSTGKAGHSCRIV